MKRQRKSWLGRSGHGLTIAATVLLLASNKHGPAWLSYFVVANQESSLQLVCNKHALLPYQQIFKDTAN